MQKELKSHSTDSLKIELESTKLFLTLILLNNSKHTKSCYRELQKSVQMFSLTSFLRKSWGTNWDLEIFCKNILIIQCRNQAEESLTGKFLLMACLTNTGYQGISGMSTQFKTSSKSWKKHFFSEASVCMCARVRAHV